MLVRSRTLWSKKLGGGLLVRNWHKVKEDIQVSWERPELGWTKLNFDGSCKVGSRKGSIGGVLRNHKAEFLLGYAEAIGGTTNSTIAEWAALRRGLELVLENGWNDVWLEGDAKSLVETLELRRRVRSLEVEKLVSPIRLMIPKLNNYKMTHIYREGNRVADTLARMGHSSPNPRIWHHSPPNEIVRIVNEDAQGKIIFRRR